MSQIWFKTVLKYQKASQKTCQKNLIIPSIVDQYILCTNSAQVFCTKALFISSIISFKILYNASFISSFSFCLYFELLSLFVLLNFQEKYLRFPFEKMNDFEYDLRYFILFYNIEFFIDFDFFIFETVIIFLLFKFRIEFLNANWLCYILENLLFTTLILSYSLLILIHQSLLIFLRLQKLKVFYNFNHSQLFNISVF